VQVIDLAKLWKPEQFVELCGERLEKCVRLAESYTFFLDSIGEAALYCVSGFGSDCVWARCMNYRR
jgi:hypothetical protein